tara:strand:+ start:300 stop:728 length:429 start_codon:yes stop_codon:yes gene_type:complete
MVWQEAGAEDQGLSMFLRLGATPEDRNLVSFYADAGMAYKGPFDGRDDDVVGIAFGYAQISDDASDLDRDNILLNGVNNPVRDYEAVLELTYFAQITPWWSLQPDIQFIFHPGGNVADPNDPTGVRAIDDAVVAGLRTTISF